MIVEKAVNAQQQASHVAATRKNQPTLQQQTKQLAALAAATANVPKRSRNANVSQRRRVNQLHLANAVLIANVRLLELFVAVD